MSYIGNSPGVASQRVETAFTATSNQTAFTPSSGYTLGYCDVYQNGVKLVNGDDYTASDGATVTLTTGAASGDSIVIVASFPRGLSDGYLKSEADARYPRVDINTQSLTSTQQGNARTNIGAADDTAVVKLTGNQTVAGVKSFSSSIALGWSLSGWSSSYKVLQIGSMALLANNSGASDLYSNLYYDGTNFKYMANGTGSIYSIGSGQHRWYTAPNNSSGADANATITLAAAISLSGDMALGGGGATINGGVSGRWLTLHGSGSSYTGGTVYALDGNSKGYHYVQANYLVHQGVAGVGQAFYSGNVQSVRFETSGDVALVGGGNLLLNSGAGISFAATANGNSSMSSEILTDYEEGTWTPVWNGGGTLSASRCRYTKIGRMVTLHATLDMGNNVNGGGFQISGLPYGSGTNVEAACAVMTNNIDFPSGYTMLTMYWYGGSNYLQPYWSGNNVAWTPLTNAQAANASIIFTLTYEAA